MHVRGLHPQAPLPTEAPGGHPKVRWDTGNPLPRLYSLLLPGEETHWCLQHPAWWQAAGGQEIQFWPSPPLKGQGQGRKESPGALMVAGIGFGGGLRKGEERYIHLCHRVLLDTPCVPGPAVTCHLPH